MTTQSKCPPALSLSKGRTFLRTAFNASKSRTALRQAQAGRVWILGFALLTAACAAGGSREQFGGPPLKPSANPSAVIAADLAFSQLAQDKGQWTAFGDTAAQGAEMFAPERVSATAWLKGRANPPLPVKWQPYAVWSSCDGSHAVTRGAWDKPGSSGSYVTVWQRQKDGKYKWLVDMSLSDEKPAPPPEMVAARVADCGKSAEQKVVLLAKGAANAGAMAAIAASNDRTTALGMATDDTLAWETRTDGGNRRVTVRLWNGQEFETVIDTGVTPRGP